ncbi:hypothetical protein LTR78_005434 [Recurvomyces mirabilis]|uniref:Uncharacterized protein n=1 Tax=Recurvomyces mirabilis TaxID=574656 RepID=A0AAE1C1S2_9PEZI|nr:hypothetical protein LTR78_005434 [Recurvomyces mirabilis]KAK5152660.1 hypothetical protein LTS14_008194 [Recurvomyces mirabilis]
MKRAASKQATWQFVFELLLQDFLAFAHTNHTNTYSDVYDYEYAIATSYQRIQTHHSSIRVCYSPASPAIMLTHEFIGAALGSITYFKFMEVFVVNAILSEWEEDEEKREELERQQEEDAAAAVAMRRYLGNRTIDGHTHLVRRARGERCATVAVLSSEEERGEEGEAQEESKEESRIESMDLAPSNPTPPSPPQTMVSRYASTPSPVSLKDITIAGLSQQLEEMRMQAEEDRTKAQEFQQQAQESRKTVSQLQSRIRQTNRDNHEARGQLSYASNENNRLEKYLDTAEKARDSAVDKHHSLSSELQEQTTKLNKAVSSGNLWYQENAKLESRAREAELSARWAKRDAENDLRKARKASAEAKATLQEIEQKNDSSVRGEVEKQAKQSQVKFQAEFEQAGQAANVRYNGLQESRKLQLQQLKDDFERHRKETKEENEKKAAEASIQNQQLQARVEKTEEELVDTRRLRNEQTKQAKEAADRQADETKTAHDSKLREAHNKIGELEAAVTQVMLQRDDATRDQTNSQSALITVKETNTHLNSQLTYEREKNSRRDDEIKALKAQMVTLQQQQQQQQAFPSSETTVVTTSVSSAAIPPLDGAGILEPSGYQTMQNFNDLEEMDFGYQNQSDMGIAIEPAASTDLQMTMDAPYMTFDGQQTADIYDAFDWDMANFEIPQQTSQYDPASSESNGPYCGLSTMQTSVEEHQANSFGMGLQQPLPPFQLQQSTTGSTASTAASLQPFSWMAGSSNDTQSSEIQTQPIAISFMSTDTWQPQQTNFDFDFGTAASSQSIVGNDSTMQNQEWVPNPEQLTPVDPALTGEEQPKESESDLYSMTWKAFYGVSPSPEPEAAVPSVHSDNHHATVSMDEESVQSDGRPETSEPLSHLHGNDASDDDDAVASGDEDSLFGPSRPQSRTSSPPPNDSRRSESDVSEASDTPHGMLNRTSQLHNQGSPFSTAPPKQSSSSQPASPGPAIPYTNTKSNLAMYNRPYAPSATSTSAIPNGTPSGYKPATPAFLALRTAGRSDADEVSPELLAWFDEAVTDQAAGTSDQNQAPATMLPTSTQAATSQEPPSRATHVPVVPTFVPSIPPHPQGQAATTATSAWSTQLSYSSTAPPYSATLSGTTFSAPTVSKYSSPSRQPAAGQPNYWSGDATPDDKVGHIILATPAQRSVRPIKPLPRRTPRPVNSFAQTSTSTVHISLQPAAPPATALAPASSATDGGNISLSSGPAVPSGPAPLESDKVDEVMPFERQGVQASTMSSASQPTQQAPPAPTQQADMEAGHQATMAEAEAAGIDGPAYMAKGNFDDEALDLLPSDDEDGDPITKPGQNRASKASQKQEEQNDKDDEDDVKWEDAMVKKCGRCRQPIVNNRCGSVCLMNTTRQGASSSTGSENDQEPQAPAPAPKLRCTKCGNILRNNICAPKCGQNRVRQGTTSSDGSSGGDAASQAPATGPITVPNQNSQGRRQAANLGRKILPAKGAKK